jgi:hypothetical protein
MVGDQSNHLMRDSKFMHRANLYIDLLRIYFPIEPTAKIEPTSNMSTVSRAIRTPANVSRNFMGLILSEQDANVG